MKRHWPVGAEVSEAVIDGGRMLYDTSRTSNFSPEFFDPEYWRRHDAIEGTARGRGTTWFIRAGDAGFVLRHYRRGGLVAKLSKDRYWFRSEMETRSFAEWFQWLAEQLDRESAEKEAHPAYERHASWRPRR